MNIDLNSCFPVSEKDGSRGPLPKQALFMQNVLDPKGPKYTLYAGGVGCISGSTPIHTKNGTKDLTDLRFDDVVSFSGPSFYAQASVPYPVGKSRLYTVKHTHGQFSAAGFHLVLCADGTYLRVDQLQPSSVLLQSFSAPPPTSLESYQKGSCVNALYWKRRVGGFLTGCQECLRLYGQLPHEVLGISQDVVPLLVDALKYTPTSSDRDDLKELAQGSIRPDQLCNLLSNLDSALQREVQILNEEDLLLEEFSESLSEHNQVFVQSQLKSDFHQLIPELLHDQLKSFSLNPQSYTSSVISIERECQESWYWDFTVPGANNYSDSMGIIHHNSGKTMIGCITMLILAIQYPGDYLIGRQFAPELKITTLKQFLEVCPKELIDEYRVADGIIRIKATGGRVSNIIFRQLEEPDKLRSLNLSGFYIDESSQVSESAFMLLQGRLRGPGLRKGFLTTNPAGHDWQYAWFVKQDMFTQESLKKAFSLIKAPSTENTHLPEGYVETMMATWSQERVQREIMGSFDAFEGMVYHEFRRDVHVIKSFVVPKEWTRIIGADHGYRNPAAWLFGAVDYDDNIYIYREFYKKEWLIEEICKGNKKLNEPGILQLCKGEKIDTAVIDPSVRAVRGATGHSDWDVYMDNLPSDFPLQLANNDKSPGIDRVKSYLKLSQKTNKPKLYIFDTCTSLIDEMSKYRYKELREGQKGKSNEREEPNKVDDHACDALRYLIMTRPEAPDPKNEVYKRIKYNSLEGSLYRDLQSFKKPKNNKDPWGDSG